MSDRSSVSIKIGGTIATVEAARKLVTAIIENGAGFDYDEMLTDDDHNAVCGQLAGLDGKAPLTLCANEVVGGMFPELEETCRALGLPYHRADDGHYAYPASHSAWMQGMDGPVEYAGSQEDGPAINLRELQGVANDAIKAGMNPGTALFGYVRERAALLKTPPIRLAPEVRAAIESGAILEDEAVS